MLYYGKPLRKLACGALCCVAAAVAVAGPPAGNLTGGLLGRTSSAMPAGAPSRSPAARLEFQRLDLRPPESLPVGHASASGAAALASSTAAGEFVEPFPSAHRVQWNSTPAVEAEVPGGANVATLRMENKVQELSRRVPREGLPLARLWETKTALLHVGLSPKGKPGLWLTQKVP